MKQIKFLFATIMAVVCLTTFSSCSDDKDEPAVPAAKTIQGTYAGDLECTVMGSSSIFEDKTLRQHTPRLDIERLPFGRNHAGPVNQNRNDIQFQRIFIF